MRWIRGEIVGRCRMGVGEPLPAPRASRPAQHACARSFNVAPAPRRARLPPQPARSVRGTSAPMSAGKQQLERARRRSRAAPATRELLRSRVEPGAKRVDAATRRRATPESDPLGVSGRNVLRARPSARCRRRRSDSTPSHSRRHLRARRRAPGRGWTAVRRRETPGPMRGGRSAAPRARPAANKRPRHQRDDAERGLADRQRRVAALKVPALVLGDLDVEKRNRELAVARADVGLIAARGRRPSERTRAASTRAARSERISSSGGSEAVRRPVGQPIVVVVHASERRVHRAAAGSSCRRTRRALASSRISGSERHPAALAERLLDGVDHFLHPRAVAEVALVARRRRSGSRR